MGEGEIVAAIIEAVNDTLLANVWRTQSGKVKVRGAWMQLAPAGTPDILGYMINGGRMVGLEVKQPKKKATDIQIEWRNNLLKSGGIAAVVFSVEDAINVIVNATAKEHVNATASQSSKQSIP
jgi:hypothetical protein